MDFVRGLPMSKNVHEYLYVLFQQNVCVGVE